MFSAPFAGDAPVSDGAPIAEPTNIKRKATVIEATISFRFIFL